VELTGSGLSGLLSTGIGHVASTIAAVIGLIYLFLVSGDTFLRKLVLVTPSLKDKKRAVEIARNIETDTSFYLLMVASINIAIGFIVMPMTGVLGISDPSLRMPKSGNWKNRPGLVPKVRRFGARSRLFARQRHPLGKGK
jgi:predicted PurR-regulated permease PerM